MKSSHVQKFYNDHVTCTQYCFQIRKCLDSKCIYHSPLRMDCDRYKLINWLPMPSLLRSDTTKYEKYKTFQMAYEINGLPSDGDRPGASKLIDRKEGHLPPMATTFKYVQQRVRKIVWCKECGKPRLIYSQKKLPDKKTKSLIVVWKNFLTLAEDQFCLKGINLKEKFLFSHVLHV